MNLKTTLFAAIFAVCCVSLVTAQETAEPAQCNGECPIAKAMGDLPKMTYKVGEEMTCCSTSAAELAETSKLPIQFVVGEETFETKETAMASLVSHTEEFVTAFVTPSTCEVSGTTKIAGEACNCPVKAGQRTELVKAAVDGVKMTFTVGDETCDCPNKAAALAASSDAEKLYVVGEESTCCEMTARLNLARAKYKAAVQALASADKPATETMEKGS